MAEFYAEDRNRERRLAEIRARRGTPEREARIAEISDQKAQAKQAATKRKSTSGSSARKTRENSTEYHGHSWDEWDAMRDAAFALVVERAAKREFTAYTDIWSHVVGVLGKELGNAYFQLPALLEHMTLKGLEDSELIVTALVTYEGDEPTPGPGFFAVAVQKGTIASFDAPAKGEVFRMTDEQRAFWQQQVDGLFAKYGG